MNTAIYAERRQRLTTQLGDGIAIIPTAPEKIRNRDAHYAYRYDSYFWYLTGFSEPESLLVLIGGKQPQSVLFCRNKNEEREIWDGFRYGPAGAIAHFGFDTAFTIDEFDQKLPELLADKETLWYALGHDAAFDARITQALNCVRGMSRAGKQAPQHIRDIRAPLDAMRLVKDAHEIQQMKQAAQIASVGHTRAMQICRPGLAEYVLEAELTHEFRRQGADGHAYTPIVAAGDNACVLHYVNNNATIPDQALVLIDAGCELGGYASDVTRTFPSNGRFTPAQRDAYSIVLAAQQAAIEACRPGQPFIEYHNAALKVLAQGMLDLKLLSGSIDEVLETESYRRFYMHRTGHWLGLDVHDAGEYKQGDNWTTLKPGMVLTVEPGLYIRPADDIPPALAGIGIRIEDDVLITVNGCEVYSTAPKSIADIEATMRHD